MKDVRNIQDNKRKDKICWLYMIYLYHFYLKRLAIYFSLHIFILKTYWEIEIIGVWVLSLLDLLSYGYDDYFIAKNKTFVFDFMFNALHGIVQ